MRSIAVLMPFLTSLLAAESQEALEKRKNWPVSFQSMHYEVRATCPQDLARKLAGHMDLVFETYTKLFALRQVPSKKAVLVLFKDEAEYKANGSPEGSTAYYDPNIRYLVGYADPKQMFNVFAHEGTHQFTDLALKNIDRAPPWFIEGIADCIGNSVIQKGRLFMCARNGFIAQMRLPVIQQMIKDKTYVPLKELVRMGQKTWDEHKGDLYPESWSFCSFLLAYPKYEETKSQLPNGKYWTVLSNYIKLLADGRTDPETAFRASFQVNGKALDLDVLEKEWIEYILKMENSGTLVGKEFAVGKESLVVSPELTLELYYPAKENGDKTAIDRSKGPCPLLLFTADPEDAPYKLCELLAHELAASGYVAGILPGKGAPEDAPRLLASREALLKRNADKDPTWKGVINPAQVIVVGYGPGASAALAAGADGTKVSGVVLLAPPASMKPPDKFKAATLILGGEDGQAAAAKIYSDLKKPRYLFSFSGLDNTFSPLEKADKPLNVLWNWLEYRYWERDEFKPWIVGQEAQTQFRNGELKQWKVEE